MYALNIFPLPGIAIPLFVNIPVSCVNTIYTIYFINLHTLYSMFCHSAALLLRRGTPVRISRMQSLAAGRGESSPPTLSLPLHCVKFEHLYSSSWVQPLKSKVQNCVH